MKLNLAFALPVVATYLYLPHSAFARRLTGIGHEKEQSDKIPQGQVGGRSEGHRMLPANGKPLPYSIEERMRMRAQEQMDAANAPIGSNTADVNASLMPWTQLCNQVEGTPRNIDFESFGVSIAMAKNGNIFAVGGPWATVNGRENAGVVRVFKKDLNASPNCWVESATLSAASGNFFGLGVAMTEDGSRLVAAGYGVANVFKAEGPNYVLVDELPETKVGPRVSISDDGETIAVGRENAKSALGEVNIYEYDKVNNEYKHTFEMSGVRDMEWFGASLSLSADGNLLVVGSPIDYRKETEPGIVRLYEKIDPMNWQQKGSDLFGDAANDNFGGAVSMAGSGKRFAVGALEDDTMGDATGSVKVFSTESLEQVGKTIYGEDGDFQVYCGWSVSLDFDGHRLAAACPTQDNVNQGIRVFDNSNDSSDSLWVQEGDAFGGGGRFISLARDGKSAAIGDIWFNGGQGKAVVYLEPKCTNSLLDARLETVEGDTIPFNCRNPTSSRFALGGYSCNKSGTLASHCPKMCNACEDFACADSEATFMVGGVNERTCSWLADLRPKRRATLCQRDTIQSTCRKTCDYCS